MAKPINKSAKIRELLAAGWTPQQIIKKVRGAKLKDVHNVTYLQRKQELAASRKRADKTLAKGKATPDTKADYNMTGEEWLRALRSMNDESLPTMGVEITARIVLDTPDQFDLVEEVLEKAREYGSAEITRQVALRREQ